uniref:Uncharacterized protein n=1 Tax=Oryza punctata TaxID=4537 RepID=A0A0E0KZF0_ORYPU
MRPRLRVTRHALAVVEADRAVAGPVAPLLGASSSSSSRAMVDRTIVGPLPATSSSSSSARRGQRGSDHLARSRAACRPPPAPSYCSPSRRPIAARIHAAGDQPLCHLPPAPGCRLISGGTEPAASCTPRVTRSEERRGEEEREERKREKSENKRERMREEMKNLKSRKVDRGPQQGGVEVASVTEELVALESTWG